MSITCRTLQLAEKKELAKWLTLQNLELNGRTRRRLTDVLPVARMFRRIYAELVSMQHYKHASGYNMKLQNWKIFNEQVLTKLGMGHSILDLEQLAKGRVGAIDTLLYNLMSMARSKRRPPSKCCSQKFTSPQRTKAISMSKSKSKSIKHSLTYIPQQARIVLKPPNVLCVDMEQLVKGKMVNVPSKLVAYEDYLDALRECQEKDSCMNSVRHKTQYLESLTKLKDERIEDLMRKLKRLAVETHI